MKYTVITIAAAIATTFGLELTKTPPAPVLPEVVAAPPKLEPRQYTATVRIEALCPVATAVALSNAVNHEVSEGSPDGVMAAIHCIDCRMGVYAVREDSKEYCSYCNNPRN